jgi:WD40 repeat protein
MTDRFTDDVYLRFNYKDLSEVRALAKRLRAAGLRVLFQEWLYRRPAIDQYSGVGRGGRTARVEVLCLSPATIESKGLFLEHGIVPFSERLNGGRFILLLLANCELPDILRGFKYIDYRTRDKSAFSELLNACRTELETALPTAKFRDAKGSSSHAADQAEPLAVFERELIGHSDWVWSVAVSPDGKWAASGSQDRSVKIWELETGACLKTLRGHEAIVHSVAVSPDGLRVLTGSKDRSVRVWDTTSGLELARLKGHQRAVWSVVALKESQHSISGGSDGTLRLWDLYSGNCLKILNNSMHSFDDDVFSLAGYPTGTQVLSGHRSGEIRLWNLQTGDFLARMTGHSGKVRSVQIASDGDIAVSGSDDRTVKIWDLKTLRCIGTLEGHQSTVHSVAISFAGDRIASTGYEDKTVRLWDRQSGACLQVINHKRIPTSVVFSPSDSLLIVGANLGSICVYRLKGVPAESAEIPRRYVNAKVVLIGEGAVGKTSLAHRLTEDRFVVRDRTHGMNVWPLDLPFPPDNTLDREALLWDLAGQEDYRLVHRLFLDETALALLLVNPQKDDPFREAGDWIKALKTASSSLEIKRPIPRILIFSQSDIGGVKVGDAMIERFREQYDFADWLTTSAKNGENCSDSVNGGACSRLKTMIAQHIPWSNLPWTATPRLLARLKAALMTLRDKTDIRLLRFAELAQRLEQALPGEKFGEAEIRTAVTLLVNHGLARPLKFGDLVLLRPELLNGYAGAIIRAARAHRDEIGCVAEADLYDLSFDFTGVERLPRPDEELLLRAMVQIFLEKSLCIAEEIPQGQHLVFPSQYRRERDIPHLTEVFVSYTFSGEWQTIWATLVVRLWYSQEFEQRELWRNAAELQSSKGNLLGLRIENRQREGQATIHLFFDLSTPDELKVIFIEYVHRHLAKYGCEVSRDRRYMCTDCGQRVIDIVTVQERLKAGKTFIYCQRCDEKVVLIDFIEQRLKSDPVARRILAMEEETTRQLDTQALEQILIGHMMATCGEANQIFRPVTMADYGIDGEVEFRGDDGEPSGRKVYVQLKSGNSYLRQRQRDGKEVFDVKNERHLKYWTSQPVDVYLVIRQTDERGGEETIRWMNVTDYLAGREDKASRQIVFEGERLDLKAVWQLRDRFFPPRQAAKTQRA